MSSSNSPTRPLVILYVEDNAYIRDSVAEILASPAREIVCVGTRQGALEVLRRGAVDLLLTDVNLPDGSGLDLVREAVQLHPAMPVIICSSHDLSSAGHLLGKHTHVLRKPFEIEELEALFDQVAVQQP